MANRSTRAPSLDPNTKMAVQEPKKGKVQKGRKEGRESARSSPGRSKGKRRLCSKFT
jgi:hypothetical protein